MHLVQLTGLKFSTEILPLNSKCCCSCDKRVHYDVKLRESVLNSQPAIAKFLEGVDYGTLVIGRAKVPPEY